MTDLARSDAGVKWLLQSRDPSVRYRTLTELLDEAEDSADVIETRNKIPRGPRVRALLKGQVSDGGFGSHPYSYWHGTHWRLISLAELRYPEEDERIMRAVENELSRVVDPFSNGAVTVKGLVRRHACVEGNALGALSRLGLAEDPRVKAIAERLIEAQWPDGGWNSDERPEAKKSSFFETHEPLWGLLEFHRRTSDEGALESARAASEFLLRRALFRSLRTGEPIHSDFTKFHYPLYFRYDILRALEVLIPLGLEDPRCDEALEIVQRRRLRSGCWRAGGYFWKTPDPNRPPKPPTKVDYGGYDVVDWGRGGPNEMITLSALRVLKAAHRWP